MSDMPYCGYASEVKHDLWDQSETRSHKAWSLSATLLMNIAISHCDYKRFL